MGVWGGRVQYGCMGWEGSIDMGVWGGWGGWGLLGHVMVIMSKGQGQDMLQQERINIVRGDIKIPRSRMTKTCW